jgi:hypothetical protein
MVVTLRHMHAGDVGNSIESSVPKTPSRAGKAIAYAGAVLLAGALAVAGAGIYTAYSNYPSRDILPNLEQDLERMNIHFE